MKLSLSKKEIIYLLIAAIAFASLMYTVVDSIIDEILLSKIIVIQFQKKSHML